LNISNSHIPVFPPSNTVQRVADRGARTSNSAKKASGSV